MLGRLLEFSIVARPLADAIEAFIALGFDSAPVGDIIGTPYAVVIDGGGFALGLHDDELDGITPTFVRPELKERVRALRRSGVEFDFLELADDRFHRAGFRDPTGCSVQLIEARTFAPVYAKSGAVPVCGELVELSLAAQSLDEPVAFWTKLGFEAVAADDPPHASVRLRGHGLTLGIHETARFRSALTFRADNVPGRIEYLRAKGFTLRRGCPLTGSDRDSATLLAPGVQIFVVDARVAAPL